MADQKPLFKAPYDIKDVSVLFAIVAFVLIMCNNLYLSFNDKFRNKFYFWYSMKSVCTQKRSSKVDILLK